MHRFLPFLLLITALSPVRADVAALDAWLVRQSSIRTLEVSFTQERRLPALKQVVSSPGKLSFAKPNRVRWQLGEPAETLAISDGTTLTLIEDAGKSVRQIPADSPRAARFSMLSGGSFANPEAFHAAFTIVETRVALGIHQYTLQAKDRRMRSEVPWIFIDIDPARNELRALEMELRDRSRVRTLFHDPQFNLELPIERFRP
jgi:outer membrane lipoprotein carrier protein